MVAKAKVGCLAQPRSALRVQCPCLLVLLRLCPDDDVGHAALALAKLGSGHARLGGGGGEGQGQGGRRGAITWICQDFFAEDWDGVPNRFDLIFDYTVRMK